MGVTDSIEVENVVASTDLGQEFNLEALSEDVPGAQYEPDNFPGLVYRTQDPKAATLVFRSGKAVTTGAKAIEDIHDAVGEVVAKFQEVGVNLDSEPEIEVQNIVSSADLGASLNLNALAIGLGLEKVEYEPEQFPGLVYRMDNPNVVVLLFGSGKAVITGGKEVAQARTAAEGVQSQLDELGLAG